MMPVLQFFGFFDILTEKNIYICMELQLKPLRRHRFTTILPYITNDSDRKSDEIGIGYLVM